MRTKQVIFREVGTNETRPFMGIKVNNEGVICAECGGFLEMEDVEIIKEFDYWVDFSEEIGGDEFREIELETINETLFNEEIT